MRSSSGLTPPAPPRGKRSSRRDHTAGDDFIRIGGFDDAQPDMYIEHYLGASSVRVPAADLDFIAHARQDIPRLVAEIRRLRAVTEGGNTTK